MILASTSVRASEYVLAVRQVNPDGPLQKMTCSSDKKACLLKFSITLQPEPDIYIERKVEVGAIFENHDLELKFVLNDLSLSVTEQGWQTFHMNLTQGDAQAKKITLYIPNVIIRDDPRDYSFLALRPPNKKLAELEIFMMSGSGVK